jgi:hypothetical protein
VEAVEAVAMTKEEVEDVVEDVVEDTVEDVDVTEVEVEDVDVAEVEVEDVVEDTVEDVSGKGPITAAIVIARAPPQQVVLFGPQHQVFELPSPVHEVSRALPSESCNGT